MKKINNICSGIIIVICVISLIRVGYSIYPIVIICFELLILYLNNLFFHLKIKFGIIDNIVIEYKSVIDVDKFHINQKCFIVPNRKF